MRVRCIGNSLAAIASSHVRQRIEQFVHIDGEIDDLLVGAEYHVQAVETWSDGSLLLYLHTVPESWFPHPYPAEWFELCAGSVPEGWCLAFAEGVGGTVVRRAAFAEWADDDMFYERLVDGDPHASAIYQKKRLPG